MRRRRKERLEPKEKPPEAKLECLWRKHGKKIGPKNLTHIVQRIDYFPLRKWALIEFLSKNNLNFTHLYNMLCYASDILDQDKNLKKSFFEYLFSICTLDNLLELAEENIPEAIKELLKKINRKLAPNRKSLQILIRLFYGKRDLAIRACMWRKIKEHNPSEEDLIYILGLLENNPIYERIRKQVEKLLRKKSNPKKIRVITEMEALVSEINTK